MPGSVSAGFHEGFNSEKWADSVFSAIGTAVRVPPSDDFGLDLYCTLMEREHPLLVPRGYYAVQVKSELDAWKFKDRRAVRWFVEYPLAIFYCVITKAQSRIRIYNTFARFLAWAQPELPDRLELIPEDGTNGQNMQWASGEKYSLGAPILDFEFTRIVKDSEFTATVAGIMKYWIDWEEKNIQNIKHHNHRFDMPDRYETNTVPQGGRVILSSKCVDRDEVEKAVLQLKEPLDGVSSQLFNSDLLSAVRGMLLLRQLYWNDYHHPSTLSFYANTLNSIIIKKCDYMYESIDKIGSLIDVELLRHAGARDYVGKVRRIYMTGNNINNKIILSLRNAVELENLNLYLTRISDVGLRHLKGLVRLQSLGLTGARITSEGLKNLRNLTQLKILNLAHTKVASAGMRYLKNLTLLENLYLNGTKVDDAGLEPLGKLPMLEVLTLDGTKVTDRGLVYLRDLKCLRKLQRTGTKISDAGAAELQKMIPGLNIIPAPREDIPSSSV